GVGEHGRRLPLPVEPALRQATVDAVLNANYVRKHLEGYFDLPYKKPSMHEVVFSDYAKRLAVIRGRIEELLWVLGEKNTPTTTTTTAGQSVLDMRVTSKNNDITTVSVREVIEKLRRGELTMDELSADTQTMVRKGALEMKKSNRR
ncbi:MAG: hypothetical protein ICV82_06385, partial [Nitrososphaera sp.]|nr:hypothetical protein [Nitrososphaera sp.]